MRCEVETRSKSRAITEIGKTKILISKMCCEDTIKKDAGATLGGGPSWKLLMLNRDGWRIDFETEWQTE